MSDLRQDKWEESYSRNENNIFYPKEECVKFINRFIRRKISKTSFQDILETDNRAALKALDYGCGIGRGTALLHEFNIDGYGIDISRTAVQKAQEEYPDISGNFSVTDGSSLKFPDGYFDFSISESVLDSMPYVLAKSLLGELDRVTKKYLFISLISGDTSEHYREYEGEEDVSTQHESGTIQSYYNWKKICSLVENTSFEIIWAELNTVNSCVNVYKHGRYNLVLSK